MSAIRAEVLKLLTVRSTYVVTLLLLALVAFMSYSTQLDAPVDAFSSPMFLEGELTSSIELASGFAVIVAILLVTHEYRYDTIAYTLAAARRRSIVFGAKLVTVGLYLAAVLSLVLVITAAAVTLGVNAAGYNLASQTIDLGDALWRFGLYSFGSVSLAYVIAMLLRSQVGSFVTFFMLLGLFEQLSRLVLHDKADYLPLTAMQSVLYPGALTLAQASIAVIAWLVIGGAVALVLFERRDAN
ncbi:hypothetical protein CR970_02560 [Candidatus Saccharibacteria bacterium]|nr:MAG: hypothetical protein CR970_02560 [Candidatus Saccharibacteria bacterium]